MRKVILIVCMMVLTCLPVAANPVVIVGVGQVELGEDIIMTEDHDKKGSINYSFRAKDGEVWRGAILMPVSKLVDNQFGDMLKMDVLLNRIIEEAARNNKDIFSVEKARQLTVGGREFAISTLKVNIPSAGIVQNLDMVLIPGTTEIKMVAYACADSDAQYWRPIMEKIVVTIS